MGLNTHCRALEMHGNACFSQQAKADLTDQTQSFQPGLVLSYTHCCVRIPGCNCRQKLDLWVQIFTLCRSWRELSSEERLPANAQPRALGPSGDSWREA